jgi:hypothetical protein
MVGYLKDKELGALLYNLVHNYALALLLTALGVLIANNNTVSLIGIILIAHVGLDRALGYGLKYSTNFKDTHIQKV